VKNSTVATIRVEPAPSTSIGIFDQQAFGMTAAEPVYASTSALNPTPESLAQSAFTPVSANLQQFVGQQFQLQLPDSTTLQMPSSSQVLHIRTSDGQQVQDDQIDTNDEPTTEQTETSNNAALGKSKFNSVPTSFYKSK
jgi:hypothetical protein